VRRLLLGQAESGIAHNPTPIGKDSGITDRGSLIREGG
jgi:hypothetical protein